VVVLDGLLAEVAEVEKTNQEQEELVDLVVVLEDLTLVPEKEQINHKEQ